MANTRNRITNLQKMVTDLEQRITSLQQLTTSADGRFQEIQNKRAEAVQVKNEITAIKQQIESLHTEIQQKNTSAKELENSIQELVDGAEGSKETFEEHSKNLQEIEEKIKGFEQAITEQLGRAGSGALALAFAARQDEVQKELNRWRKILFITTVSLAVVAVGFLVYSFFVDINVQFFLKMFVSFPFIFAAYFASRQYNKERFIVERYAFKAAQAKSLSAFSKTVKEMDLTENGQAEAQKFVIASVEKIYIQPKLDKGEDDLPLDKALDIAKDIVKMK